MKTLKVAMGAVGFALFLSAQPVFAFEISFQDQSCGISALQYLENELAGQISAKAFQTCNGQAVRQVSPIRYDVGKTDDGLCEAFDEVVTGTAEFECL